MAPKHVERHPLGYSEGSFVSTRGSFAGLVIELLRWLSSGLEGGGCEFSMVNEQKLHLWVFHPDCHKAFSTCIKYSKA